MQKIYKFHFQAKIQTVTLNLKFPCVVSVSWRRGEKMVEVKRRKEIERGVVSFNETLDLECNMGYDPVTKRFEEKKTKFTVLIFSEKGNKQAGELYFDVSELLNAKQKEQRVEKLLEKCPDKNAKLTFVLTGQAKEQVQSEAVSHRSDSQSIRDAAIVPSVPLQPDFKKKKQDIAISPRSFSKDKNEAVIDESSELRVPKIPVIKKESKERLKLEEENRKLRQQVELLRVLEVENNTLKRRYEEAEKKASVYYNKKMEEARRQYEYCKAKVKKAQEMQQMKLELQKEMCDCKQRMGRILNYAIMSGNNQMTEEIYTIYQSSKP